MGVILSNDRHGPVLAHILRDGEWFGSCPALIGGVRAVGFRAKDERLLLALPLVHIRSMQAADAVAALALGALGQIAANIVTRAATDMLIHDAWRRLAATLMRVLGVDERIAMPSAAGFRLTQSEPGEMANASRHHVNRTLKLFEAKGWVRLCHGHIAITHPAELASFASA